MKLCTNVRLTRSQECNFHVQDRQKKNRYLLLTLGSFMASFMKFFFE